MVLIPLEVRSSRGCKQTRRTVSDFYERQGLSFISERQLSCEEGRTDPIGSSRVNMWRRWRTAARRFPSVVQ